MLLKHLAAPKPGTFDPAALRRSSPPLRVLAARRPYRLFRLLRSLPVFRAPFLRFLMLSRFDEVREVLFRDLDFSICFDEAFGELDPEYKTFVLGLSDDEAYRSIRRPTMNAFRWTDAARVGTLAFEHAEAALQRGHGRIDAMQDLITASMRSIIERYVGVPASQEFVLWTYTLCLYDFLPWAPPHHVRDQAAVASESVARTLLAAIRAARESPAGETAVSRLVAMTKGDATLDEAAVRAILTGMIAGLLSGTTLAAANLLEVLLDNPRMMVAAEEAARAGDDDLLGRCLLEASRFRPLAWGLFRKTEVDTMVADGTPRAKRIRRGELILAGIWPAMLDPRGIPQPWHFDPLRPADHYLGFGHGQHWCLGSHLALAHMTQCFKPLLQRGGVRRAHGHEGRTSYFGPFAEHLTVLYHHP